MSEKNEVELTGENVKNVDIFKILDSKQIISLLGLPAKMIKSDAQVQQVREQRAAAQAQQARAAQAATAKPTPPPPAPASAAPRERRAKAACATEREPAVPEST